MASRERAQWFLTAAAREKKPLILDADGLNLLAMHPQWKEFLGGNVVLTPHIGEMSRLCGRSIGEIQETIAQTAVDYAKETGTVCVQKDACTVVTDGKDDIYLNLSGNSGNGNCRKRGCTCRTSCRDLMYVSENGGTALHGFKGRVRCLSSRTLR